VSAPSVPPGAGKTTKVWINFSRCLHKRIGTTITSSPPPVPAAIGTTGLLPAGVWEAAGTEAGTLLAGTELALGTVLVVGALSAGPATVWPMRTLSTLPVLPDALSKKADSVPGPSTRSALVISPGTVKR
jgi:hypothetical protein